MWRTEKLTPECATSTFHALAVFALLMFMTSVAQKLELFHQCD
jgi:hypothetical protein